MKYFTESIDAFFRDSTRSVLAVKGPWGVGKTFFWRTYVETHKPLLFEGSLGKRGYSYVSLFGVKDTAQVLGMIADSIVPFGEGWETVWSKAAKGAAKLLDALEIPHLRDSGLLTGRLRNALTSNILICLDDLERKHASLTASEILGLICQLKEEMGCKIVLIYNEEALAKNAEFMKDLDVYREKVFDTELSYNPSIEDNVALVEQSPQFQPTNTSVSYNRKADWESAQKVFRTLRINNIRVIFRACITWEYFRERITKEYAHIAASYREHCLVLTTLFHGYLPGFTIKDATSYSPLQAFLREEKDEEKQSMQERLLEVGFIPQLYDSIIEDYLRDGYVDLSKHTETLRRCNEDEAVNSARTQHREVWSGYTSNFQMTVREFVDAHVAFLKAAHAMLPLGDVAEAVDFLKRLDPTLDIDNVLQDAITRFVEGREFTRDPDEFLHLAPHIAQEVRTRIAATHQRQPLNKLVSALASTDSWNPFLFTDLKTYTAEEWYEWLSSERQAGLLSLLRELVRRCAGDDDGEVALERMGEALERISKRSVIDESRVRRVIKYAGPATVRSQGSASPETDN